MKIRINEIRLMISSIRGLYYNSYYWSEKIKTFDKISLEELMTLQKEEAINSIELNYYKISKYYFPYNTVPSINDLSTNMYNYLLKCWKEDREITFLENTIYPENIDLEKLIKQLEINNINRTALLHFIFLLLIENFNSQKYNQPIFSVYYKDNPPKNYSFIKNQIIEYYMNHRSKNEKPYESFISLCRDLEALNVAFFLCDKIDDYKLYILTPNFNNIQQIDKKKEFKINYLKIIKTLVEKIKQNTDEIYNMENYDEFTQIVEIKNLMEFHSITKEENLVIGFPTKIKELKNDLFSICGNVQSIEGGRTSIDELQGYPLSTYLKIKTNQCTIMVFKDRMELFNDLKVNDIINIIASKWKDRTYHFVKMNTEKNELDIYN